VEVELSCGEWGWLWLPRSLCDESSVIQEDSSPTVFKTWKCWENRRLSEYNNGIGPFGVLALRGIGISAVVSTTVRRIMKGNQDE